VYASSYGYNKWLEGPQYGADARNYPNEQPIPQTSLTPALMPRPGASDLFYLRDPNRASPKKVGAD